MSLIKVKKSTKREKRRIRIQKRIKGTPERPRLTVYRSLNHIYAQLIDDTTGKTLGTVSTLTKDIADQMKTIKGKIDKAKLVGKELARHAQSIHITSVVFDRNGYLYHGRVKGVAEGAREGGLQF